jgi:hypothetical protein
MNCVLTPLLMRSKCRSGFLQAAAELTGGQLARGLTLFEAALGYW